MAMPQNTYSVFYTRMPAGTPGALSRPYEATVEQHYLDTDAPAISFGDPVKVVRNKITALQASDGADAVYGFLVRVYPSASCTLEGEGFGKGTANPKQIQPVMTRGYMSVRCAEGTPEKNSQVYVRIAAGDENKPIGQIEAALVAGETVAVPNCIFTGPADENSITEIRLWR